jgi:hypothetical protein
MSVQKSLNNHTIKDISKVVFVYYIESTEISIDLAKKMIAGDVILPTKRILSVDLDESMYEYSEDETTIKINLEKDKGQTPTNELWSVIIFVDRNDNPLSYILYQVSTNEIDTSDISKININYKIYFNKKKLINIIIDNKFYKHLTKTMNFDSTIHNTIIRYTNDTTPIISEFLDDNTYSASQDNDNIIVSHIGHKYSNPDYVEYYRYKHKESTNIKYNLEDNLQLFGSSMYGMHLMKNNNTIYTLNNLGNTYTFTELKPIAGEESYSYVLVEGIILVAYRQHEIYIATLIEDDNKFSDFKLVFKTDRRIYIPSFYDLCPVAMLDNGQFIALPNNIDDEDYELHTYIYDINLTYSDIFYNNTKNIYEITNAKDLAIMMSYFNPSIDPSRYWDNLLAMRELYNTMKILPKYRRDYDTLPCKFYDCGLVLDYTFLPYSLALNYNTKYFIIKDNDYIMNMSIIRDGKLISMITGKIITTSNYCRAGKYGYILYSEARRRSNE